jgi:hypothetical protein
MNGNGPNGVVSGLTGLGQDAATLAELQLKLAAIDLKKTAADAKIPILVLVGAVVVGLATLPILLLGAAELVARATGLAHAWSLLLTAAAALVIALVCGALAWTRLRASFAPFGRSREELRRNIAWIRNAFAQPASAPRRFPH